jgi:hypothetical protein
VFVSVFVRQLREVPDDEGVVEGEALQGVLVGLTDLVGRRHPRGEEKKKLKETDKKRAAFATKGMAQSDRKGWQENES